MERQSMDQEVKAFLNKFIAALSLYGVETIPFSGEDFQKGINVIDEKLRERLDVTEYKKIADAFVKVPVEESYQQIRGLFMNLNGQGISFSGVDNPMWNKMSIRVTPYAAGRILNDNTVFAIDKDIVNEITKEFCEAAGVTLWEEF